MARDGEVHRGGDLRLVGDVAAEELDGRALPIPLATPVILLAALPISFGPFFLLGLPVWGIVP